MHKPCSGTTRWHICAANGQKSHFYFLEVCLWSQTVSYSNSCNTAMSEEQLFLSLSCRPVQGTAFVFVVADVSGLLCLWNANLCRLFVWILGLESICAQTLPQLWQNKYTINIWYFTVAYKWCRRTDWYPKHKKNKTTTLLLRITVRPLICKTSNMKCECRNCKTQAVNSP